MTILVPTRNPEPLPVAAPEQLNVRINTTPDEIFANVAGLRAVLVTALGVDDCASASLTPISATPNTQAAAQMKNPSRSCAAARA